ncbi:helix-turn-helix domain-containing protein (plasmid) [Candidatus Fukatsuia symbiotica]|nr:helix-turn-helix domain-containing protein [Candidatus Fukatsuia symbiotica]MEA9445900.1 helix-turn-helix domain-containing protein [Candidatus Fukatsuia symbiotica]
MENLEESNCCTHHIGCIGCSHCALCKMGKIAGLTSKEIENFNSAIYTQKAVGRGQSIYIVNAPFKRIYVIKSGSIKTVMFNSQGQEHITGFYMAGELLGFDGICAKKHQFSAISMEHSQLCFINFYYFQYLCQEFPVIQNYICEIMSDEIVRAHNLGILLVHGTHAEERLATFLLSLSRRLSLRGCSPLNFHLRMTREEIANYLGTTLETVSRTFSKLQSKGLIKVQKKDITIINIADLERIMRR